MKIFLIRHGESIQNTKESYGKSIPDSKIVLTNKGKEQARKAGEFLKDFCEKENIDLDKARMWVSPFERTRETARIINESLNIKDVKEDIALIEQRYGLFSDDYLDNLKERFPEEFKNYDMHFQNDAKFYAVFPQGEAPYDVALRVRQFIETIHRDLDHGIDTLFIVSHGVVIKSFVLDFLHMTPEWYNKEITPGNCAIRYIKGENKAKCQCPTKNKIGLGSFLESTQIFSSVMEYFNLINFLLTYY